MGEITFEQSAKSVPHVRRVDGNTYQLWFTAFDENGDENEIIVLLNDDMFPIFRQYVNEAEDQADSIAFGESAGIRALVEAFETGGDVVGVWLQLVNKYGRADISERMTAQLGWDKAHEIHRKIKGED